MEKWYNYKQVEHQLLKRDILFEELIFIEINKSDIVNQINQLTELYSKSLVNYDNIKNNGNDKNLFIDEITKIITQIKELEDIKREMNIFIEEIWTHLEVKQG